MFTVRAGTLDGSPCVARVVGRWVVVMTASGDVTASKELASGALAVTEWQGLARDLTTQGLAAGGYTVSRR